MKKSATKVLAALERVGGFASAQELHVVLKREHQSIGLTTVYRALQTLVDEHHVDVLRHSDGEARYRRCGENHHHHLVCKSCGRTEEIAGEEVEEWAKNRAAEYGFREIGHTAEIYGLCSSC